MSNFGISIILVTEGIEPEVQCCHPVSRKTIPNNDRPVKKVRLSTEQQKSLELKQTSQELIKQVKCLTDDVRDMIEKCEQHLWKKHPHHKQSSVIRIEEQLSVAKQLYDNVVNNKNSIKINLALISGTGRGKSYIGMLLPHE